MLMQFGVENFLSFRDKQVFTALANSKTEHEENLVPVNKSRYSKINVVYGANASGKTNLLKAMAFVRRFVSISNGLMESEGTGVVPFAFDENTKNGPSRFELLFVRDGVKYAYSFACTRAEVLNERLDVYERGQPKLVFDRKNVNEYVFNSFENVLRPIAGMNTRNKLFLCSAATWNVDTAKSVVNFIVDDLVPIFNYSVDIPGIVKRLRDDGNYDDYKRFCINLLSVGDFSISDFDIRLRETDESRTGQAVFMHMPFAQNGNADHDVSRKIAKTDLTAFHTIEKDGDTLRYPVKFAMESRGTQALFNLAPVLYDAFKNGKTLLIDEIDRSLHPLLVHYVVSLFADPSVNTGDAQLICNTHDTNLLDLDLLRRDEIWFTERDPRTGATLLYPLTDYAPRKTENIEKGYVAGRYGAIPFIDKAMNPWE